MTGTLYFEEEETAEITKIYNEDKIPSWITDEMIDEEFEIQLPRLLEQAQDDYYEDLKHTTQNGGVHNNKNLIKWHTVTKIYNQAVFYIYC